MLTPSIHIRSENDEFQIIEALKRNRAKRAQSGEVFIEGIEAIKQAVAAEAMAGGGITLTRVICPEETLLSGWAAHLIATHPGAAFIAAAAGLYRKLCDREKPSEIVATARVRRLTLDALPPFPEPFIVLFDRPGDTGNLGSIIRSANALGADALFILGHGVDVYDPKTIRASLGSVFHTRIVPIESMAAFEAYITAERARSGLKVIGTDSAGAFSLDAERVRRPIMLALGNEARGLSVALKPLCDAIVRIPLTGAVDSLNVAAAAAIFMWRVSTDLPPGRGEMR